MVALAPITNETPAWDVLNTFPKLHSRAREVKTASCTEAPASKSLVRVEIWLMISESCVGLESFTRDPIGFAAGSMGLHEYCHGMPFRYVDPTGMQIMPPPHPPSPPTPEEALAYALIRHWFFGFGAIFTEGAEILKNQANVKQEAMLQLQQIQLELCKDSNPDGRFSGNRTVVIRPQPNHIWLIRTMNVPSEGLTMNIKYSGKKDCDCCKIYFDVSYLWVDKADMHPYRHPLPDGIFEPLRWIGVGQEYWIKIQWYEEAFFQTPMREGGCPVVKTGWPSGGGGTQYPPVR